MSSVLVGQFAVSIAFLRVEHGIVVVAEVPPVDVVYVPVSVIVNAVVGYLAGVDPNVLGEIRVVYVGACIYDGDYHLGRASVKHPGICRIDVGVVHRLPAHAGIPVFRREILVVKAPHAVEIRIIGLHMLGKSTGRAVGVKYVVFLGVKDAGKRFELADGFIDALSFRQRDNAEPRAIDESRCRNEFSHSAHGVP